MREDDMYHTCRNCKYFDSGCCYLGMFFFTGIGDIYKVSESGSLSAVIEETLYDCKPEKVLEKELRDLNTLLYGWKVSKKRRREVEIFFIEELSDTLNAELRDSLDEAVSRLYQDRLDTDDLKRIVMIEEPDNFYCSRWE